MSTFKSALTTEQKAALYDEHMSLIMPKLIDSLSVDCISTDTELTAAQESAWFDVLLATHIHPQSNINSVVNALIEDESLDPDVFGWYTWLG